MDQTESGRVLAVKTPDGLFSLIKGGRPLPNAPRFKRFEGCIAWLDPKLQNYGAQNWLIVVGETEDGSFHAQEEIGGPLDALAIEAVNAKDRYFLQRIYIDDTNVAALRILKDPKQVDGLWHYGNNGEGPTKTTLWHHPPEHWPYYRDRDTKAALIPISLEVRIDLLSAYEFVRKLSSEDKIQYRDHVMPVLATIMNTRPPLEDVIEQPLCKAFLWLITMMLKTRVSDTPSQGRPQKPWYPNMAR